jgi:hypothetical protein
VSNRDHFLQADLSGLDEAQKYKFLFSSGMPSKQYEIALSTFEKIISAFPSLTMNLDLHPANVELALEIFAQRGLLFDVYLNLQNRDELHLNASRLWVEWFPCTKPDRVTDYFEAVCGLLSGRFRILEQCRGRRVVKAQLQSPSQNGWKPVATSGDVSILLPWPRKRLRVVQNTPAL